MKENAHPCARKCAPVKLIVFSRRYCYLSLRSLLVGKDACDVDNEEDTADNRKCDACRLRELLKDAGVS